MTIEDWTPPPRDKVCLAIEGMLRWIREDYGEGFEAVLIRDILMVALAWDGPTHDEGLLLLINQVALDWSK